MIIRNPTIEDIPYLKSLWIEAFGEEERDYVERFFDKYYKHTNGLIACTDKPCAMLFLLDYDGYFHHELLKCGYLYAVATSKGMQGRGVFRQLHRELLRRCQISNYDLIFTIPATESLFDLYRKLGYQDTFSGSFTKISNLSSNYRLFDNDYKLLYNLYKNAKKPGFYILLDFDSFVETQLFKNIAYIIKNDEPRGYIVYDKNDDNIIVRDYMCIDETEFVENFKRSAMALTLNENINIQTIIETKPKLAYLLN